LTCHEHAIAHYAAEGMTVYDFLAGDDRYKLSLATGQTPMHWVTLAPRRSLAALTAQVRRMLRRIMLAGLCAGVATGAHAADIPQPKSPEQVVGIVVENTADAAMPPRLFSFGQVFRQGQVPSARAVSASSDGQAIPIQVDVMARYPDGSARIGVVTLRSPALGAHQTLPVMLSLAGAANAASTDITTPAEAENLTIDLTLHSTAQTTAYHIDAHAQPAPDRFWRQGNLANERRLDLPIAGALHVVLDITRYADGTRFTDVQFRNDVAMGQVGGTQIYDVRISLGGKTVFHDSVRQHFQYQSWHVPVWSSSPPSVNVQHDIAALEQTGMVPAFDVRTRVSPKILAEQARLMATPGWGAPLAANGVAQYMATTGARGDIGPTTRANAIWLITQSPEAAAFALGQADAAGAIPWQFWNARAGTWLNTAAYPDIWVDGRGGPASYTTGLTQPVDPATGWATDTAHQPDLAYIAYLMTGQRRYLDLLNAQAAYSITGTWPDKQARNRAEGNVIRGNQLRAAAWSLRQIDEAAWANPPGSAEARYFAGVADANWRWLVAQLPAWTRQEGATAGYILGAAYGEVGMIPPWQQDYFVSTAVAAAEQGNADALTYLRWSENFIAGRFLAAAAGFRPHNGISYLLGNICGGAICQSWAALQGATEKAGQDNGSGWAHSDGDYGALALASLAGLITVTHAPRAQEAYRYLLGAGAPQTGVADQQTDLQLNIVPQN
jgi:hypothetical protein